jgi:hypothetical protein
MPQKSRIDAPGAMHHIIVRGIERRKIILYNILSLFDETASKARQLIGKFVREGIADGKRSDLICAGLIRSIGGRKAVKTLQATKDRIKGNERILGDSDFVQFLFAQ